MVETSLKSRAVIRIVDDDAGVRESYKFLIESDGWLVRTYPDAESFLAHDDPTVPGCGVIDVRMPGISGMELQKKLNELSSRLPIIFVSAHGDIEMAVRAMQRGAHDFLAKPVTDEKLLNSITRAVEKGCERWAQEEEKQRLKEKWATLSPREKEVAALVAEGLMNKVIADRLSIAERTVQVHRANVCQKLGAKNAVGIAGLLAKLQD